MRHPNRWPRGAVLVEFCIVLPLFLVLLMGAMDWGWYFAVRETAINATREGARAGAVAGSTTTAADIATSAVQNYLTNALGSSYVPSNSSLTVSTPACGTSTCVSVKLSGYPVVPGRPTSSITGLGDLTHAPATLTVQAEMRLEESP